jgi:hypothetical protein
MIHPIYHVVSSDIVAPYTLRIEFDDATSQVIDVLPVLEGELYRPLRDLSLFNQEKLTRKSVDWCGQMALIWTRLPCTIGRSTSKI